MPTGTRPNLAVGRSDEPTEARRLKGLLFLRVLATFMVVFGHAASFFSGFAFTQWPQAPYIQSIAVTVFFCLSGYTIAWVCANARDDGATGFWRFAFDRCLRLLIPLVPVLGLCAAGEYAIYGDHHPYPENFTVLTALGNIFFLQNMTFLPVGPFGLNRPLWTLSIEFFIYLAFAGLFFGRDGARVPLVVGLIATIILLPYIKGQRGLGLPLVWLAGALSYYALRTVRGQALYGVAFTLGLVVLALPPLWPRDGEFGRIFNALIFLQFVLALLAFEAIYTAPMVVRVCEFFGRFAYTVYLVHYPLMYVLNDQQVLAKGHMSAVIATGLSFVVAYVISLPFEQRYKQIRAWVWGVLGACSRHAAVLRKTR
jgi:peptidoglycan/LPS O-acetylase OafA/YrhL